MNALMLFKKFKIARKQGFLTKKEYYTLIGQVNSGNSEGAIKGYNKILKRAIIRKMGVTKWQQEDENQSQQPSI